MTPQEYHRDGRIADIVDEDCLDTILALLKQMEATLIGLQLRGYVGSGVGAQMLNVLIEELETGLAGSRAKPPCVRIVP